MRTAIVFTAALCLLAAGCSGGSDSRVSVPRRTAYPRIEVPDSVFTAVDSLPVRFEANAAAESRITRSDASGTWLTVSYPGLNALVYCTMTPVTPSTIDEVLDNRVERISLNVGANDVEITEFRTPQGFENRLFSSRAGTTTPIQFIATDGRSVVVSGAAFLPEADSRNTDSIQPVVDMLRRDILHSLKTLAK